MSPYLTIRGDVATITYSTPLADHKFEAWAEGETCVVEYQESCFDRGVIRAIEPAPAIYRRVMQSDEMTQFLEHQDCPSVQTVNESLKYTR